MMRRPVGQGRWVLSGLCIVATSVGACSESGSGTTSQPDAATDMRTHHYWDAPPVDMSRDVHPPVWDYLRPPVDGGITSSDGGPDAEVPFEPFPLTREAARSVTRMLQFGDACIKRATGKGSSQWTTHIFHPVDLYVQNSRAPGMETFRQLPPLRCEAAIPDCDAFLACAGWAPRWECEPDTYRVHCLPGDRVVQCLDGGYGSTLSCRELGGTCPVDQDEVENNWRGPPELPVRHLRRVRPRRGMHRPAHHRELQWQGLGGHDVPRLLRSTRAIVQPAGDQRGGHSLHDRRR